MSEISAFRARGVSEGSHSPWASRARANRDRSGSNAFAMCQVRCIVGNNSILDRGAFFLHYVVSLGSRILERLQGKGEGRGLHIDR